ncbi:MAG: PQQ-like beta-propeller repeat protein [Candidatus Bathyarchaeota archaeon]|nr:PQQ-like beta-propeller repeat protein [Candidatus Bathyarchaeota archaeon]
MLSTTAIFFNCLPTVSAAEDIPTYAYLSIAPNPIGAGQTVSVAMWLNVVPPLVTSEGSWAASWDTYTVSITDPSGETETKGPFTSDSTAYYILQYVPDMVGTYTFEFNFAGQPVSGTNIMNGVYLDNYYQPSKSSEVQLTVQQEPLTSLPQTSLPTDYWQRPINAQNHQWSQISGNWLGANIYGPYKAYNVTGNFNAYTTAPDSAHIVWTKPLMQGGLIGGEFGGSAKSNFYTGKLYEPAFTPPIIINGVLYYNQPTPTPPREGYYAVDLRTGQTLWWRNGTGAQNSGISIGQVYNCLTPNQEGGIPYLWWTGGPEWYMYDASTGNLILTLANATPGGMNNIQGPNGELLIYLLDAANNWLAMWNSSSIPKMWGGESGTSGWQWRPPVGATLDWLSGIQWNVTIPSYIEPFPQSISTIGSGIILATTGSMSAPMNWQMEIAYSTTDGHKLWAVNRTTPLGDTQYALMGPLTDGIYTEFNKGAMQWYGYSASTGEQLWGPSEAFENAWASQPSTPPLWCMPAYGNIYQMCVDGIHALDMSTGERLWDFYAPPCGFETSTPAYPFMQSSMAIADGKVFATSGIQYGDPLFRGAALYAINADSGKEEWSICGFFTSGIAIADGYLVAFNGYDNQIYCFGKGQTATTVSAPQTAVPLGTPILIQGTITDQSPGQTVLGIPAAGTPAISDDSMTAWMEYLYEQQPKPTDAVGVPVHLTAIDANGNTQEIGTVVSDIDGVYMTSWTPSASGIYRIVTSFEGSDSYYRSTAKTGVVVSDAGQTAPTVSSSASPSQAPAPSSELSTSMYLAIGAAVVIVIVAIVAVARYRRKK